MPFDVQQPQAYQRLTSRPISGGVGAEIEDLGLSKAGLAPNVTVEGERPE